MKLCLNMIVKNEAARIERCLASVAPYIANWCIVDTGSTDDTKNIVKAFFAERKILGQLPEYEFRNFSDARNYAIERARIAQWGADYFLLVDADMELVVDDPIWAEGLFAPSYKITQKNGDLYYWNVRLLRADQRARYIGVTHEYLSTEGDSPNLTGAWFIDHGDGANREGKFKRDADLLRADVADKARSFYYLAQSLRDMGEKREAAEAYGIAAKIARWDEERWSAELNRARCLRDLGAPEWIECALRAFGYRPTRAEPLYDLARHYREQGLNEVSLLFSECGLAISRPNDLLFIEDSIYAHGLREEFAICAFYSDLRRARGRGICNDLALDRAVPAHVRETARRNLFFYAQPLDELCSSFAPWRKLESPTDWNAMNPSVARLGDRVYAALRTVNYTIDEAGRYIMPSGETAIRTHNYLVAIEPDGSHRIEQDIPCDLGPALYDQVLGLEDMRLFEVDRKLWFSATTRQTNAEGWAEQGNSELLGGGYRIANRVGQTWDLSETSVSRERRHEKNWMPLVREKYSGFCFVYRCDPTVLVDGFGRTLQENTPPFACENFSGGSQLIPFDGGYLCLIHEAIESPLDRKRCYQHRFCWFDAEIRLQKVSPRFWLQSNNQIEFAAGMCWHPDEERLIISYGIRDAEAWLGTVNAIEVRSLLGLLGHSMDFLRRAEEDGFDDVKNGQPVRTSASIDHASNPYWSAPSERRVPRHDLPTRSFGWPPSIPKQQNDLPPQCDPLSYFWARGQTNRPLRTGEAVDVAISHLRNLKLPLHPDRPKNWDNMIAIAHATATATKDEWVLDAGGTNDSAFLPGLRAIHYEKLLNANLDYRGLHGDVSNGIVWCKSDITDMRSTVSWYTQACFSACLSVIEHGVDVRAFLREMARIIKPGGHLFISFDYWDSPIDCGDRMAFGAPVRIFAPTDVKEMIDYAGDHGLVPTSAIEYDCQEHVVEWIGLKFTFMNLLFRRG